MGPGVELGSSGCGHGALIAVAVLWLASPVATRWRTPFLVLDGAAHFLLLLPPAVTWVLAMFWLGPRAVRAT